MANTNDPFDILSLIPENNAFVEKQVRRTGIAVFNNLIEGTPVDTGRAKNNWNIDINIVDVSTREADAGSKDRDGTSEALQKTAHFKLNDTIYISNNLPYIVPLDEGHSQQAPTGFVDAAIATGIRQADELKD